MDVGVVTVGDELLAGDVTDTNAAWLGRRLTERGASVRRMTTVPDEIEEIAAVIGDLATRYDAVVVTGGLGPTHDDVTLEGVAAAFDRELIEHPDAVAALAERGYTNEELVEGTAHLPAGSRVLVNPEGVAPGSVVENVYVLPGVPDEMRAVFERIAGEFGGQRRYVELVEAAEPESALIDRLAQVREEFAVQVGSYPGETVRLKVQGTDEQVVSTAAAWLRERVTAPSAEEEGEPAEQEDDADDEDGGPGGARRNG